MCVCVCVCNDQVCYSNHLRKGQSHADKQLVFVASDETSVLIAELLVSDNLERDIGSFGWHTFVPDLHLRSHLALKLAV